ncbi:MAG: hypothetical protein HYY16_15320 [Planctomycetes bacterium]|nr:hypothetical protein [Planctomycetota bacterium]
MKTSEGLINVLVDGDKHGDIVERYGVRGYPTVLFLSPGGEVVGKLKSREPADVQNQLADIVAQHKR